MRNRIKVLLAQNGHTQRGLAKALGITPGRMSRIVTGSGDPTGPQVLQIAVFLASPVIDVFPAEG